MPHKIGQGTRHLHYLPVNRPADRPGLDDRADAASDAARETKQEAVMNRQNTFLRYALLADAVASGATGLLMIAGADLLTGLLGLPIALMREAGLLLVPYVALVAFVGMRPAIPHGAVKAIIALNIAWVAGSIGLLMSGIVAPTVLGYAFVIFQAIVVGVFAELQFIGLRPEQAAPA